MKKIVILLATALLVFVFASCKKDSTNDWQRFWGYTKADLNGHYDANPDESLYEELPTEGVIVYPNASIDVIDLSDDLVSVRLNIPETLNIVFSGTVYSASDNSDFVLKNGNDDIRMTVYKNSKGEIRFHGVQKRYHYNADLQLESSENYGFDVIKKAAQ